MPHSNTINKSQKAKIRVERTQTGVRIEKKMLKVLKGVAEYLDITLGDLLEGIVLHAFEGKAPFDETMLQRIEALKQIYGMGYDASNSHSFTEGEESCTDDEA